jgi:hypothetical protein
MAFSAETITAIETHLRRWIPFQESLGNRDEAAAAQKFLASLGATGIVGPMLEIVPDLAHESEVPVLLTSDHPLISAA